MSAGTVQPHDLDVSPSGCAFGTCVTGNGEIEYDRGLQGSILIGKRLSVHVSIKGGLSYATAEYDSVSGSLVFSGGFNATLSGTAAVEGNISALTAEAGINIYPLGKSFFQPYLGFAAGLTHWEDEIDRLVIAGSTLSESEDGTDLTLHGTVGFDLEVNESSSIGMHYRYSWMGSTTDMVDDFVASSVGVSLKFSF